jgi:hypothetical protein
VFHLDLLPAWSDAKVLSEVRHPRGSRSLSSHLKGRLGLDGIKAGILREVLSKAEMEDPVRLAAAIKALPITVVAPRPIDEVISTAGGALGSSGCGLDEPPATRPVLAGEMLDWEAPTGYLLTACMATVQAAQGMDRFPGFCRRSVRLRCQGGRVQSAVAPWRAGCAGAVLRSPLRLQSCPASKGLLPGHAGAAQTLYQCLLVVDDLVAQRAEPCTLF